MRRYFVFILIPLIVTATCLAAPIPQTRPWRVAIAGGQAIAARGGDIPGYLSLLALHGLPRVRIDETELTNLDRLRQYDVVIAAWGRYGSDRAMNTLEQFAREGGIAITEGWPHPSPQVLAGKRLGPFPSPNVRFVPSDSPISRGLPELGVLGSAVSHREAGSIIPDPGSNAIVLARYTDEEVPEKLRGQFRDGNQGAPAVLLIPCGKGTVLYCGPSIAQSLTPADQPSDHFICRVLEALSKGELTGRLYTGKVDRSEFVSEVPQVEEETAYPTPPGQAQPAPKGFEELEEASQLQDFCLTSSVSPSGSARVLVGYWSANDNTELALGSGKLTVRRARGGKGQTLATAALPRPEARLMVTRRDGLVTVAADGKVVYSGCPGPPQQGLLGVVGLRDAAYQPLAPVHFSDDFMREEGFEGEWEVQSGKWQVVTSEGKAETGVNPFNYQATANPEAISLTGDWFWSDVACRVSAQGSGRALGLIADYADKDSYLLLKLAFADDPRASRLQLLQRRPAGDTVLAEATVSAARPDWHQLELRSSRGRLQGWLNGQLVLQATGPPVACGRVGLYCEQGNASFDDMTVEPWVASLPEMHPSAAGMLTAAGSWANNTTGALEGKGSGGARLLLPWPAASDCQASVRVRVGQADAAGLLLRTRGPEGVLVALGRDANGLRLKAYRQGPTPATLVDTPATGSPAEWHALAARYSGSRLQIRLDGKAVAEVLDGASTGGTAGVYARGKQAAQFSDFAAWTEPADDRLADEVTPEFAGVIDRNTWAGRSGAWTPDPTRLDCLWHAGTFPGPVHLEAGIHPRGAAETTTVLHLGQREQPTTGYAVTAHRRGGSVDLELSYDGKTVAQSKATVVSGAAYALGLERCGADVLASVNHRPLLAWRDTQARFELCALGLDNGGQPIVADDVTVTSPQVYDYTFETAPTDWAVESGTWKVSSRWSCAPGWSWFCGENPEGPALAATRQSYSGDVDAVAYFSAKMTKVRGNMIEKLADVHFGCCAKEQRADSGYQFIVGAEDNKRTVLLREGQEVASCPYQVAQALIHNDWLRLTIHRRGPEVQLWVWDTLLLKYTDPQPLPGGRIALGTMRNGIVVPRVTIYGQQAEVTPAVATAAPTNTPAPRRARSLIMFAQDPPTVEFGGDWGLWPQQQDCQGTATFMAGQDAEGQGGGSMKVDYTIKAAPHSFSLWLSSGTSPVDLTGYDRLVLYARANVPSLTVVVKDASATDPDAPKGIADYVLTGLTDQWRRYEVPFAAFKPREAGGRLDWKTINHVGLAMVAPQSAESGTFWVDNLRAAAGPLQ